MKTCSFMLGAKNGAQTAYYRHIWWRWKRFVKLETTCGRNTRKKGTWNETYSDQNLCGNIQCGKTQSLCGKAHFSVSLQRQKPVLPTVWDGQISHLLRCKRLQNSLSLPLCPHPSSHSSFLTLVYSFHLHLYSNFYHVTFFIPHSTPTFPLAA